MSISLRNDSNSRSFFPCFGINFIAHARVRVPLPRLKHFPKRTFADGSKDDVIIHRVRSLERARWTLCPPSLFLHRLGHRFRRARHHIARARSIRTIRRARRDATTTTSRDDDDDDDDDLCRDDAHTPLRAHASRDGVCERRGRGREIHPSSTRPTPRVTAEGGLISIRDPRGDGGETSASIVDRRGGGDREGTM